MITQQRLKELVSYDPKTGHFTRKHASKRKAKGSVFGTKNPDVYVTFKLDGVSYRAHRLVWLYVYGRFPNEMIDHKNGFRGDNRLTNLREATASQNAYNSVRKRRSGSTGYKGVHKVGNRWYAHCKVNKKTHALGGYGSAEEAAKAYADFSSIHHAEFQRLT